MESEVLIEVEGEVRLEYAGHRIAEVLCVLMWADAGDGRVSESDFV